MTPPQDDDWVGLLFRLLEELPDDMWGEFLAVRQFADIHNRPPGGTE